MRRLEAELGCEMFNRMADAPQNGNRVEGRVEAPISDAGAHATFCLVALTGAPSRVREIVGWVSAAA